jgi:DNA-binding NarL/FixJ family response regulator
MSLADLVSGLGAECGTVVRTYLNDLRPVRIATCDPARGRDFVPPLKTSFADGCFGPMMAHARPATVSIWSGLGADARDDPRLAEWQAARHLKELAVLVLSSGPTFRDHIELHFRDYLAHDLQTTLSVVVPTMARVWASRKAGLVTRMIVNHRQERGEWGRAGRSLPILGSENPAHLSRAEFRVSLLLGHGLSVQGVAEALSLSEATIRTHLRNIYAKTETANLAELVFQLIDTWDNPRVPEARSA